MDSGTARDRAGQEQAVQGTGDGQEGRTAGDSDGQGDREHGNRDRRTGDGERETVRRED